MLSRQSINNTLEKHNRNGSPYKKGEKYYALIIIDDNSRYLLHCNIYERIKTEDVKQTLAATIEKYGKPEKLLVDNDKRFARKFERWCKNNRIEVEHTPLYYPQAKGKIERCIRTFNEEFLKLKKVFENIFSLLQEFVHWFNNHGYHMGIHDYPANVYFSKNVTDVT